MPYPSASEQLDYELELAAVIGREGSNVAEADAFAYIAGFTIFNDWSCRDLQRDEMEARLGPAKGKTRPPRLVPGLSPRMNSRPTSATAVCTSAAL